MEGAAEGHNVDEKMDEELPVEELSARVVRTHTRGAVSRDWCPHCLSWRASDPAHQLTERAEGEPPMVQIDYQFASEKVNMKVSAEQVLTAGKVVTIFMANFCGRSAVAAAFLMGQLAAWGLGTGALVVRADQGTSLTTLLDEIKARRAETLVERTAVESHQSIGAVEHMNREVAGPLRTLKAALDAGISSKVALDHDLISWMTRHLSWLITRFRVRASDHTAYELIKHHKYGEAIAEFGAIIWARIPTTDQRWVEVVWAGKAEGSDKNIGLDHRGAKRSRAVRREP